MSESQRRPAPILYRWTSPSLSSTRSSNRSRWPQFLFVFLPLSVILGVFLNSQNLVEIMSLGVFDGMELTILPTKIMNWCEQVEQARQDLSPTLHIKVPCTTMNPKAISAIVCMLTDGVAENQTTNMIFSATDYLHGAMALGASLQGKIDPTKTHQLLLLREGFILADDDMIRLQAVGWIVGTAPNVPLQDRYLPQFPRYKTTYTKISAIGLSEYKCVMLMDADTLAIGDLKDLLSCNIFTEPQHRVATTIDLYGGYWHYFNSGSILWKTSSKEMDRVFQLTKDPTWMKAFTSDQDFLNAVYPERLNNTLNWEIIQRKVRQMEGGGAQVVDMGWEYNAQTHVEVQRSEWYESNRKDVKILHYTEKKGWQCEERHTLPPPISEMPTNCNQDKTIPICFCREAHLYWDALSTAKTLADQALKISNHRRQET